MTHGDVQPVGLIKVAGLVIQWRRDGSTLGQSRHNEGWFALLRSRRFRELAGACIFVVCAVRTKIVRQVKYPVSIFPEEKAGQPVV